MLSLSYYFIEWSFAGAWSLELGVLLELEPTEESPLLLSHSSESVWASISLVILGELFGAQDVLLSQSGLS